MNIYEAIRTRSLSQGGREIYYKETCWEVKYLCGGFEVYFYRAPRGSLVRINLRGKIVADWVDQTEQLPFLGITDLEVFDEFQFKNLIKAKPAFVGN